MFIGALIVVYFGAASGSVLTRSPCRNTLNSEFLLRKEQYMSAMKSIDKIFNHYDEEVQAARKRMRETFRFIQKICPHTAVSFCLPKEKLPEQQLEGTCSSEPIKQFSRVAFRICTSCGLESQVPNSGLLPGESIENLKKRIFPNSVHHHYNEISMSDFLRLRNIFAYLSSDDE